MVAIWRVGCPGDRVTGMAGAIALIVVMILIPVAVLMSGAAASAIIGEVFRRDGIARHEGSELLELQD